MSDLDYLQGAGTSLQGSSTYLQGGSPTLQGSMMPAGPVAPTATPTTTTVTPTTAPKPTTTVAPKPVISSNQAREVTAQNQANLATITAAIQPQTYNLMNETVQVDPTTGKVLSSTPRTQTNTTQPTPTQEKQITTDSKTGNTTTTTTTTGSPTTDTIETPEQKSAREEQQAIDTQLQTYNQMLDSRIMKNDAMTEALINSIKQNFAQEREETTRFNQAMLGGVTTAGIRAGRQRYATEIQGGIIGEEVRQGVKRIAELDAAEASAIMQAQTANDEKNFAILDKQMQLAADARKEKRDVVQNLYEQTMKLNQIALDKMKQEQTSREMDLKEQQFALDVQNTLSDNSRQALSTILTNFGGLAFEDLDEQSQAQLEQLASDVGIPSGILRSGLQTIKERQLQQNILQFGEKQALEQQKLQMQQQQNDIKNQIALAHLAISQSNLALRAAGGGLTANQINSTVNQIRGNFDNEPIVKNYNTIADSINTFKNLGSSPTDDIYRVYAFAKVADPNSAVREGEYKTVQDYSTALLQRLGLNAKRVFSNEGFLTQEARNFMNSTLDTRLQSAQQAYNNVASEYQRQIDDAYAGKPAQITNYSQAFNSPTTTNANLDDLF